MARNKAVKKKSKAKASAKGKAEDGVKWREQLSRLGLKIVHVTADGNCFFRAIADQLEGYEEEHLKYRQMVVDYMEEHRQDFEPFVEDEVPFDEYCKGMRENGTWAGHMELQAASLVTRTNICIHKIMSPRWQIRNFEKAGTTTLHLSYHDCEHYNSVRGMDDDGMGPAKLIVIQGDNNLQIGSKEQKGFSSNATSKGLPNEDSVKVAMVGSGCKDHTKVQEVLHEVRGDIDAVIEYLITERRIGDTLGTQDASPAIEINGRTETSSAQSVELGSAEMHHSDIEASSDDDSDKCNVNKLTKDAKAKSQKVARNKPCPCGSKKKYKNCCGAVRHKTVARIVTGGKEVLSNKARKIRSRSDKVLSQRKPSSPLPEHNTDFDMGSLCI